MARYRRSRLPVPLLSRREFPRGSLVREESRRDGAALVTYFAIDRRGRRSPSYDAGAVHIRSLEGEYIVGYVDTAAVKSDRS